MTGDGSLSLPTEGMMHMKTSTKPTLKHVLVIVLCIAAMMTAMPVTARAAAKKPVLAQTTVTSAVPLYCNRIYIAWEAGSTRNITHYLLRYRQKTGTGWSSWKSICTVSKSKISYTYVSTKKCPIKAGATYQYAVKAYNKPYDVKGTCKPSTVTAYRHHFVTTTVKATCKKAGKRVRECESCGFIRAIKTLPKTLQTNC